MARTDERGGPQTRARILEIANRMFMERGYDSVTVAQIAREAGVSSVTVFNHFSRKEDLFLDRAADAAELLRSGVRYRGEGIDALDALHDLSMRLFEARHPLSGVDDRSTPFFKTVADSPALIARAREIAADLQRTLAEELDADETFHGDPTLFAALFIAGYSTVLAETARRVLGGEAPGELLDDHRIRLERMFDALRNGLAAARDVG